MKLLILRFARITRSQFWREAATVHDTATILIIPFVLLFGLIATVVVLVEYYTPPDFRISVEITPYEVGGAILGMLMVLRTNEGLSRWWEARKLWGGIVNQCRNIAVAALAYGPKDPAWRAAIIRWTITFAHACRHSLRGEREIPEIAELVGNTEAENIASAQHMPGHIVLVMARILRVAVDRMGMDRFSFIQIDKERMTLIDHIGGCERILKTPMPRAYSITIRRFIFAFLFLLPFCLIPKLDREHSDLKLDEVDRSRMWLTPLVTMLVAFPLLALDRIGSELQNPFGLKNLNHLDLDGITTTIEQNLLALLEGPAVDYTMIDLIIALDEGPVGLPEPPT